MEHSKKTLPFFCMIQQNIDSQQNVDLPIDSQQNVDLPIDSQQNVDLPIDSQQNGDYYNNIFFSDRISSIYAMGRIKTLKKSSLPLVSRG